MQDNPPHTESDAGEVFIPAHLVSPRAPDLLFPPLPGCLPPPPLVLERHFSFKRKEEANANTSYPPPHLPEDLSVSGHFTVGLTKRKGLPAGEMTTKL